ncbi:phosphogluconate dehydrogenase (NAD(+)-dependent, decarboxylating) [Ferrimicrobium sp.]|uniref:phosphogluconate dehydrogenase (NAD(+)-dependent, decarboxylating) n=1 Tax=Ferrimicrobium sp. TaxID=2926050 RepID=UPI002625CF73|nr:decarboxylating 6-phosphogluconate dehydrogenase [Ferrimicrobium sp.]
MQLGIIGLGRMGMNMGLRLQAGDIEVLGYDASAEARKVAEKEGLSCAGDLREFVRKLATPRAVWLMVPAAVTEQVLDQLIEVLDRDDVVIDGGNGFYRDDQAHAVKLAQHGIHHMDAGTSGGVWGRERGYCLMVGGEQEIFERIEKVFAVLAPGVESAPRTDSTSSVRQAELGYLYCGDHGAGHFVKMVHNGIEYGMMASLAEGFAILEGADIGARTQNASAEVAPLHDPTAYQYDIPVAEVAELWRRGSVVASWLLDLAADALRRDPTLDTFRGRVSDSGEGRWTVNAAIDEGVPAPTIAASLFSRFSSQGSGAFSDKVLSALRKEFGGHDELPST